MQSQSSPKRTAFSCLPNDKGQLHAGAGMVKGTAKRSKISTMRQVKSAACLECMSRASKIRHHKTIRLAIQRPLMEHSCLICRKDQVGNKHRLRGAHPFKNGSKLNASGALWLQADLVMGPLWALIDYSSLEDCFNVHTLLLVGSRTRTIEAKSDGCKQPVCLLYEMDSPCFYGPVPASGLASPSLPIGDVMCPCSLPDFWGTLQQLQNKCIASLSSEPHTGPTQTQSQQATLSWPLQRLCNCERELNWMQVTRADCERSCLIYCCSAITSFPCR